MNYTLDQIWEQFRAVGTHIDTDHYDSVIYKGAKIIRYHDDLSIKLFCTASDLYKPMRYNIVSTFVKDGFDKGIKAYRKHKYELLLREPYASEKMKKEIRNQLDKL